MIEAHPEPVRAQPSSCNGRCPSCCRSRGQHAHLPDRRPTPHEAFVREQMRSEYAHLGTEHFGMSTVGSVGSPTCTDCDGAGAWICDDCDGKGRITEGSCLPCADRGCKGCLCTSCDGVGAQNPCACVALAVPA